MGGSRACRQAVARGSSGQFGRDNTLVLHRRGRGGHGPVFVCIGGCIFVFEMLGHAALLTARSLRKPKDTQTPRKSSVSFGYMMERGDGGSGRWRRSTQWQRNLNRHRPRRCSVTEYPGIIGWCAGLEGWPQEGGPVSRGVGSSTQIGLPPNIFWGAVCLRRPCDKCCSAGPFHGVPSGGAGK